MSAEQDQILSLTVAKAPLETWQPDGVTLLAGDPAGHGFTLAERTGPNFSTGVFACDPSTTRYELASNEIIYVVEGSVSIALDDDAPVHLKTGDLAFLPKGHMSTWEFHERFKEVWFLVD